MDKEFFKLLEKSGKGSLSLVVVYCMFSMQASMNDISKSVSLNDNRLTLIEYQISQLDKKLERGFNDV